MEIKRKVMIATYTYEIFIPFKIFKRLTYFADSSSPIVALAKKKIVTVVNV